MEELQRNHNGLSIEISHHIADIKKSDIIIAATNAPEALIQADDLQPGAIVINDAQPSDISSDAFNRDDVLIIEGGVIRTPNIQCNFNLGLVDREDTFCCLGEVLILAYNNNSEHFALGELDKDLVDDIIEKEKGLNFIIPPYQNNMGYISKEKIDKVKEIIRRRINNF